MKKVNKSDIFCLIFLFISLISFFIGFILNEDLSTGGASWDFDLTWNVVLNYANYDFSGTDEFTRHVPLHYVLLSAVYKIFEDQYLVRIFYLSFSLLLPIFLYLNLKKIYNVEKKIIFTFSFSLLFIPFFRATAIWPNAHLTALIFFVIGNYFYLKSINEKKLKNKLLNLLFMAFATYSIQTYLFIFGYYLINYFIKEKKSTFVKLFLFCSALGIPGLFMIGLNSRISNISISKDIFYTLTTNFSIIFLFLLFLLFNKKNSNFIISAFKQLKKIEIVLLMLFFSFIIYNLDHSMFTANLRGGGFFYKISHFIFNNNLIFFSSFFFGLLTSYLIIKHESNLIYVIILINLMGLNYQVYQKYFEPLFLILIFILYKNFLTNNILSSLRNVLYFYLILISYYSVAYINYIYKFSYKLVI